MTTCPKCRAPARVAKVDEHDPKGVRVTYVCPNPRCANYKQECGHETRPRDGAGQ